MFYFSGPSGDCLPLKKIKTEPPDGEIIQVTVPGMVSQPHGKAHAESFHISAWNLKFCSLFGVIVS